MQRLNLTVIKPRRRRHYVIRWTDPITGRRRERTSRTHRKREAEAQARKLADRLGAGLAADDLSWSEFCHLYERHHLRHKPASLEAWGTVCHWVDRFGTPRSLQALTGAWVAQWQDFMAEAALAPNSVATYSARLKAALRWAVDHEFLIRTPKVAVRPEERPRSRAITGEEFDRLLAAAEKERPRDYPTWQRLLTGQLHSGLRISELLRLSWDLDAPVRVERGKRHWLIVLGEQKNRKRQVVPAFPEFWDLVLQTPEAERVGPVFPLPNGRGGQISTKRVVRRISDIGRRARVVTNPETRKHATSHDLRRAFTIRLLERLSLADAVKVSRHATPKTLLNYYHTLDAETLASKMGE